MRDLSDGELTALVGDTWEALESHLAGMQRSRIESTERLFRFEVGLHSGFLNGVLRATVEPGDDSTLIGLVDLVAETRARFGARGLPWRWNVGPTSSPGLADALVAAGLTVMGEMTGMAMDMGVAGASNAGGTPNTGGAPAPRPVDGGRVTEVLTHAELEVWLSVRRANLGLDEATTDAWRIAHGNAVLSARAPLRHFVGRLGDRPVAGLTVFLGPEAAGIYHVDTIPEARGRGFGSALTARAMLAAHEAGYRYVVLVSSQLGHSVYRGLGFRDLGRWTVLVDPGG